MRSILSWLNRWHRVEILAALAVAARVRKPLPEAIEGLQAQDPLLRRSLGDLPRRLRQGADLAGELHARRVIDTPHLDEPVAGSLSRLAEQAGTALPPCWRQRQLPVVLLLALMLPLSVVSLLMGQQLDLLYRILNIRLIPLTELVASPILGVHGLGIVVATLVGMLVLGSGTLVLERTPGLCHALHLCFPEVHRQRSLLALLLHLRRNGDGNPASWQRDWSTWWFLTALRFEPKERRAVEDLPTLSQRLCRLGVVRVVDGALDVGAAEALARDQLHQATTVADRITIGFAMPLAIGGIIGPYMTPILSILQSLGGGAE